jgi:probable rRNA maturation factor
MIANRQRRVSLDEDDLGAFAARAAAALRLSPDSFTVALVSDRRIAALNRRYRRTPRPTDVLSFPLQAGGKKNGYQGDIVISVETARRNAGRLGHGAAEEIKLLILHGLLHLLGYDHERDHGEMSRREHRLRRRLGLE